MNTTSWKIDPTHSEISFTVKHMMISTVRGTFDKFDASIISESDDFKNAVVEFNAQTASVNTKNADRDNHLKSPEFFNSAAFPGMKFKSTSFDGEKLVGQLTIKDVTKEVTLEVSFNGIVKDLYGQMKAGFEINGDINRKDFGLTWSAVTEAGSIVVSEKVKLIVDAQFTKQG